MAKRRIGRKENAWVAIVAALALLVHTVVAGVVDGALASPQLLDIFGNAICSLHGGEAPSDSSGQPSNHSHLPDCCVVGCSVVAGHGKVAAAPVLPTPSVQFLPRIEPVQATATQLHELSPLNPRAPPVRA